MVPDRKPLLPGKTYRILRGDRLSTLDFDLAEVQEMNARCKVGRDTASFGTEQAPGHDERKEFINTLDKATLKIKEAASVAIVGRREESELCIREARTLLDQAGRILETLDLVPLKTCDAPINKGGLYSWG